MKLLIKHPKGKVPDEFYVDPAQSADTYEKHKIDAYWRAVDTWNRLDSSTRFRIPTTRLPVGSAD